MGWETDNPLMEDVQSNSESVLEQMARRNIFVHEPDFNAPLHPKDSGKLGLTPPFFGGVALVVDTTADVKIGPACFFDDFVVVLSHVHDEDAVRFWEPIPKPKVIGAYVHIGMRATILGECESIGDGAVIMDGAVVSEDVPPWQVWGGNPAKFIRNRPDDGNIKAINEMWNIEREQDDAITER